MPVPALECDVTPQEDATDFAIEVSAFDLSIDAIWPDAGIPVGVMRSAEFLNWRYERPGNATEVCYIQRRLFCLEVL